MNAPTTMLHVRMDRELKAQAIDALDAMGLSASDAVRILFKRIVAEQGFPLDIKVPNAETRAAIEEARQMMADGRAGQSDVEALFAKLDAGAADGKR